MLESGRPIAYEALKAAQKAIDEKNPANWQKRGLIGIKYDEAELAKFRDVGARPVWDTWVKEMSAKNIPAKELLDW